MLPGRWLTRPNERWHARRIAFFRAGCQEPETLFIAMDRDTYLRSSKRSGIYADWSDSHDVVKRLDSSCVGAIVQRSIEGLPNSFPQFLLEDSYVAIPTLAKEARSRMSGTVIAITGTVGKSTAKDMLARVLAMDGTVVATRGKENARTGVPVTLANAVTDPDYCILEVAQSTLWKKGDGICTLVRPHIAVVTEIGITQASRVDSEEETARIKSKGSGFGARR